MRRKKPLPVYQYKLRLHVPKEPKPPDKHLPHLVFYQGRWHLFRNRWKSRWRCSRWGAANISGTTIAEVKQRLAKAHDRHRFGYFLGGGHTK